MKVKITVLTENNKPASALKGAVDEEMLKGIWQAWFDMITVIAPPENEDKATVLSVELIEDGDGNQ